MYWSSVAAYCFPLSFYAFNGIGFTSYQSPLSEILVVILFFENQRNASIFQIIFVIVNLIMCCDKLVYEK